MPVVIGALLWHARDAILGPPNALSSALSFLYADYRDGSKGQLSLSQGIRSLQLHKPYYLWELFPLMFVKQVGRDVHATPELDRGILAADSTPNTSLRPSPTQLLVGPMSLIQPGTPVQLLLAIFISLINLMLTAWVQPYRRRFLNFLAMISAGLLQFLFLVFLTLLLAERYGVDKSWYIQWYVRMTMWHVACGLCIYSVTASARRSYTVDGPNLQGTRCTPTLDQAPQCL